MAEMVRLRHRFGGNHIEIAKSDRSDPKKYGPAEKEDWEEVDSEEVQNEKLREQSGRDSKRYDREVRKDEGAVEKGAAVAEQPAPPRRDEDKP